MPRWSICLLAAALSVGVGCDSGNGNRRREAGGETRVPSAAAPTGTIERFPVPAGAGPHDVAPAADGTVWYTAQRTGALGRLDPATGRVTEVPLGSGSAPHGVIVGPPIPRFPA